MINNYKLICFRRKRAICLQEITFATMNTSDMFSEKDLDQILEKGIEPKSIIHQQERFRKGFPPLKISEAACVGNGILDLSSQEIKYFAKKYEEAVVDVLKFVPASGAATRMFKELYGFLEKYDGKEETLKRIFDEDSHIAKFFKELDQFAFYEQLNQAMIDAIGITTTEAKNSFKHDLIVQILLSESGLSYGTTPKGLIQFHCYEDHVRTPVQEHLAECLDYATNNDKANVHFTVSPTHRSAFEKSVKQSLAEIGTKTEISVTFSEQFPSTDTIAVKQSYQPYKDENDDFLFRPAGHGALLANLNEHNFDIIFIKNIDNVAPNKLREEGAVYKKALAGILLSFQERIFKYLNAAEEGVIDIKEGTALLQELGIIGDFNEVEVRNLLDRPIRICGMVKNEGEPGGGPFWVKSEKYQSLQIVESAQIEKSDSEQLAVFESGTHFNPVDIVCGVKSHKGEKYDLLNFRDEDTGFISEKSYGGDKILAMELPGLWNGSMSNWNTVFVEVPLATFNPVKTVTDLLKPNHR